MQEFNHLAPIPGIRASALLGIPCVALCGLVWHPEEPHDDLDVCPACLAAADRADRAILAEQADLAERASAGGLAADQGSADQDDEPDVAAATGIEWRTEYRVAGMPYRSRSGAEHHEASNAVPVPDQAGPDADVFTHAEALDMLRGLQGTRGGVIESHRVGETPWAPVEPDGSTE